ncbi:hypothetical protein QCA50_013805 [Cerrena zonata]|uniref:F-box domain-containing protein n=1 Tax=Cerrena zonata TaxID=2478898 RepID=A0AAW0FUZ5_9APHY
MSFLLVSGCALLLVVTASITVNDADSQQGKEMNTLKECRRALSHSSIRQRKPRRNAIVTRQHSLMLPQELIDEIIEYLQYDKPTLKACALTHRMFLPRARRYLFRTLFVRKYGPDPYKLRTCPDISKNFREVIIRGKLCSEVKHCSSFINYDLVETLRLEGSHNDWTQIEWSLQQSDLPAFPALKNLSLHRVYFSSFKEMISTLRSYSQLDTLSLDFGDSKSTFACPAELGDYELLLPIQSLHMHFDMTVPPGSVPNVLLSSAGDNLRHLSLNITSTTPHKTALAMMNHVDLSKNASLESLELRFQWYTSRPPWVARRNDLPYIHLLLSKIHSSSLHSITFHLDFVQSEMNHPRWLNSIDLQFLDHLVHPDSLDLKGKELERARAVSKNLKKITLILGFPKLLGSQASSQIVNQVKAQLPSLESRGMLRIMDASQC